MNENDQEGRNLFNRRRDLYGTGEVNEHDVSSTGEVNVVRQHKLSHHLDILKPQATTKTSSSAPPRSQL